ncbi:transporter [Candidatus Methylomirabilis sp.]|uniref:transporter n=1 Tax=Candidatus Methylomirabilis sp. TaxID=2032687 RepID=UPI003076498E
MTLCLRSATVVLLILLIGWFGRSAEATDLKNTIRNLYGSEGILIEPSPLPFFTQESRFQASSLQGLEHLNTQVTSAIGLPSFSSSVTGFTFDMDRGIPIRTTESLGPLLTERATTLGAHKLDVTLTYTRLNFTKLQGKDLDHLELVFRRGDANGNGIRDTDGPFSFESDIIRAKLKVDLNEDIIAFIATYGITSVWDIGLVVPLTHIRLVAKAKATILDQFGNPGGTRIGDLPIHRFGPNSTPPNASGGGEETGIGDVILRTKYNFLRNSSGFTPDMAFLFEVKLPTGDEGRLLGTGGTNLAGLFIASKTYGRWFTPHVNVGYEIDTKDLEQNTIRYALGFDARLLSELSFDADVIGRFKPAGSRTGDHINDLSLGVKWNPLNSWVVRTAVQIPLDKNSGLRADFIPTVGVEYLF